MLVSLLFLLKKQFYEICICSLITPTRALLSKKNALKLSNMVWAGEKAPLWVGIKPHFFQTRPTMFHTRGHY